MSCYCQFNHSKEGGENNNPLCVGDKLNWVNLLILSEKTKIETLSAVEDEVWRCLVVTHPSFNCHGWTLASTLLPSALQTAAWRGLGVAVDLKWLSSAGTARRICGLIDGDSGGNALMGEDGRAIIDHQSQQLPNQCGSPAKGTRRRSICSARETVFWLAAEPKENHQSWNGPTK